MAKKVKEVEEEIQEVQGDNFKFVVIKSSQFLKEGEEYEGNAEMVNAFMKKGWIKLI